jgi:uncharacterized protein (TIGR00255 family)
MIISMTGFGKSSVNIGDKIIKTEIRSLNSKSLDLSIKVQTVLREHENSIRTLVANQLERGKIEIMVSLESSLGPVTQALNIPLLKYYFTEIKQVAEDLNIEISNDFLPDLLRIPDIMRPKTEDAEEIDRLIIENSVNEAIEQVQNFRKSEGMHLYNDISAREKIIRDLLNTIEPYEKMRIQNIREKIIKSLNMISDDVKVDQNRFEQEVIFYLEKLDITEEKVRLQKHLDYFDETLACAGAGGKKLGFIAQEIGREINTIGSKANDASMQQIVVQMKDELEKIKEQLMNVL